jgi:Cft2 family RNA processing exonuclease
VKQQSQALPIYCSEDTATITPIMLEDTRRNYERMLAKQQLIASHDPQASQITEQYTQEDVYDVETRLRALRFPDPPMDIPGTALRLRLFPAGHILGAASVLLEGGERRVVISGDISSERQATLGAATPPTDLSGVDLLVLESTYGDRDSNPGEKGQRELVEFVRQATKSGTALLPCFALGRGQEVLKILLRAKREKELDPSVTIWIDGLIRKILPVYIERGRVEAEGYQEIVDRRERAFAIADCQRPDARAVVVTTSGMLNGGPIVEWADALLRNPRNRLALLGYQDEGSAGGRLKRQLRQQGRPPYELTLPREEGDQLQLQISNPLREIGLSAHADANGLVKFACSIGARHIALVHGEPSAQEALENRLSRELPDAVVSRPGGEPLHIA